MQLDWFEELEKYEGRPGDDGYQTWKESADAVTQFLPPGNFGSQQVIGMLQWAIRDLERMYDNEVVLERNNGQHLNANDPIHDGSAPRASGAGGGNNDPPEHGNNQALVLWRRAAHAAERQDDESEDEANPREQAREESDDEPEEEPAVEAAGGAEDIQEENRPEIMGINYLLPPDALHELAAAEMLPAYKLTLSEKIQYLMSMVCIPVMPCTWIWLGYKEVNEPFSLIARTWRENVPGLFWGMAFLMSGFYGSLFWLTLKARLAPLRRPLKINANLAYKWRVDPELLAFACNLAIGTQKTIPRIKEIHHACRQ